MVTKDIFFPHIYHYSSVVSSWPRCCSWNLIMSYSFNTLCVFRIVLHGWTNIAFSSTLLRISSSLQVEESCVLWFLFYLAVTYYTCEPCPELNKIQLLTSGIHPWKVAWILCSWDWCQLMNADNFESSLNPKTLQCKRVEC